MKPANKMEPKAESPDAYVAALSGWQRALVEHLRAGLEAGGLTEQTIKWTNLTFLATGPVAVIRAEDARVILAFFRGKRLTQVEPRLKSSGKFELANLIFAEGETVATETLATLAAEGIRLNTELGDPTKA